MSGTYRPVYNDDSIVFGRDTTSEFAKLAGVTGTVTASNYHSIAGAESYSIIIPGSLTGLAGGKVGVLAVEINNSNPINRTGSDLAWQVNPLLNQPSMGQKMHSSLNQSFTANWTHLGVIATSLTSFTVPARWIRLVGLGLTAAPVVAYLWTDACSQGN